MHNRRKTTTGWAACLEAVTIHVAALAHAAITRTRSWCANSPIARVRLAGELERAEAEVSLLREILRIKDARMDCMPAQRRPLYSSTERLAILELRAAQGWSAAETARVFQVDAQTVANWMRSAYRDGNALVQMPGPVNRFPDFVARVVQRLKVLCPAMGKKRMAETLARAGLHLAATTIGRMLARKPVPAPHNAGIVDAGGTAAETAARVVTPKRPNHVWHVDLTVVPTGAGFWTSWLPFSLPQCWPFCWWVAVVVDHFSRCAMGFAVFPKAPAAADVTAFLDRTAKARRADPKYIISDRGVQFDCAHYRDWCRDRPKHIRPRFGAVGRHGSIAIVERWIRTMKELGTRRITIPLEIASMRRELGLFVVWYNEHRPHQALGGRTPMEVYLGVPPANEAPRIEPREKWPSGSLCASPQAPVRGPPGARFALDVSYLAGRRHLPVVELREAA